MTQTTPISSRKRPSPDDRPEVHDSAISLPQSPKRQRTTTSSLPKPRQDGPTTPPPSAQAPPTTSLKLTIPQTHPTRSQQRNLTRRRADAQRWKPKLQRPYPGRGEIKAAYPLKLMRHYPNPNTVPEPDFVKPRIENSPRVNRLLEKFPLVNTTIPIIHQPMSPRALRKEADSALHSNRNATRSDAAQRLAWLAFSLPEEGRVDRGREAMMQSGLVTDDLDQEAKGERNGLPEWKKYATGRFRAGRWGDG